MLAKAGAAHEVQSLRTIDLLKKGDLAPLTERLDKLMAKRFISPAEGQEIREIQTALAEVKKTGWTPKAASAAPAPSRRSDSGFEADKRRAEGPNLTGSGGGINAMIDRVQAGVDKANMVATVGSLGAMATGVGLVPGAIANVVGKGADAINTVVDLAQAGVALATGNKGEALKQGLSAGGHALGVIPGLGDARKAIALGKAGTAVAKEVGKEVTEKVAEKAGEQAVKAAAEAAAKEGTKDAGKAVGSTAATAGGSQTAAAAGTAATKQATKVMTMAEAKVAEIKFPDVRAGGTSNFRTFASSGKSSSVRVEDLLSDTSGIGRTSSGVFEKAIEKKLLADPTFAKDRNAFNEAFGAALGKLQGLDKLRPRDLKGRELPMTKEAVEAAVKKYDSALAQLKGAPIAAGSVEAEMLSALGNARQGLANLAANWKPGVTSAALSAPKPSIFSWLG